MQKQKVPTGRKAQKQQNICQISSHIIPKVVICNIFYRFRPIMQVLFRRI